MKTKNLTPPPWHALSVAEIFKKLNSSKNGLTRAEAEKRQQIFGKNALVTTKPTSLITKFLRLFNNILIYVLLISAVVSTLLSHFVDAGVIFGVLILNAIFGCIQEGKAESALNSIKKMLATSAHVMREGKVQHIDLNQLVPGDVVYLESGDKIPADMRIIVAYNLQVQESILTGEAFPVEKNSTAVKSVSSQAVNIKNKTQHISPRRRGNEENVTKEAVHAVYLDEKYTRQNHRSKSEEYIPLAERSCMLYSGTMIVKGRGIGIIVATGTNTEVGRISQVLANTPDLVTPLIQQMNRFGRWLTLGILSVATLTFAVGTFIWHDPIDNLFMAIVGIVVAAVPEGIPAIMTIILAIGVMKMAKQHAIIRHLPAVETMGAITTICTDKTGTLTKNELAVRELVTARHTYAIYTNGYDTIATFNVDNKKIEFAEHPLLYQTICAALLCQDTLFKINNDNKSHPHSDPLDAAFWTLGLKAKLNIAALHNDFTRVDLIPFDSQHKLVATLYRKSGTQNATIFIKGAPEQILKLCRYQKMHLNDESIELEYWHQKITAMTKTGARIIAVAYREVDAKQTKIRLADLENKFTLLGIFALVDPLRPESKTAVKMCQTAGIAVKMITGDHAVTATSIAEQVGIINPRKVLTGKQIESLSFAALKKIVRDINVYARTTPENKFRLVKALKATKNIVAMTGDGMNDAPALKTANIGIAMGKNGTEAAKEAAAMVLTDDNFATITSAIFTGRTIYNNLKKAILYILPTSIAQAFAIIIAIFLGQALPISPVQILWVNMVTTVTLSLALAFEPSEESLMQKPPRRSEESLLSLFLLWRTLFVSVLITAAAFALFWSAEQLATSTLNAIQTVVVNMIVVGEIVYLFNCRKIYTPSWRLKILFGSKPALIATLSVILLQLAFTYLPIMQHFFGTAAVTLNQWLYISLCGMGIFFIIEVEKFLLHRKV